MPRVRISTTVDRDLLARARECCTGEKDASVMEQALAALIAQHRRAEVDASYSAYDELPLSEPDAWGDLESFLDASQRS